MAAVSSIFGIATSPEVSRAGGEGVPGMSRRNVDCGGLRRVAETLLEAIGAGSGVPG